MKTETLILHNIISPYKTLLFNTMWERYRRFAVAYVSETESMREWIVKEGAARFPFEVMFRGRIESLSRPRLAARTLALLRRHDPDVLLVGGYYYLPYWVGLAWAKARGRKVIVSMDSNEFDKARHAHKEFVKRQFISRCDAGNAFGTASGDYLVRLGLPPARVFRKTSCTNNSLFARAVELRGRRLARDTAEPARRSFLYVGRLAPEKNLFVLLDAYRRLAGEGIDWGLILVGGGPQQAEIEAYVRRHGLKDVRLVGFRQQEELPALYAQGDVFILPSTYEPWGLVVNEAMAGGLPVLVSTQCGACADLVRPGVNGFSFDPRDVDRLFLLMKEMARGAHDLAAMGEASRRMVDEFAPERAAGVVLDSIEFVLSRGGAARRAVAT